MAGYTEMKGRISSSSSSVSNCGWVSCSLRLNTPTLPENTARTPGLTSDFSLWPLKNVQSSSAPFSSRMTTASSLPLRERMSRSVAFSTCATTVMCSPISRPAMSVSLPRST